MKIATFNCNSVRSRLDVVLRWLADHDPDILCLQETKVQDVDFPVAPFTDAGWQIVYRGEKSYNGVAIISKKPADDVSFGLDTEPADGPRLAHARFGDIHVVNTYVPQGRDIEHPMYAYKLDWFARLKRYFEKRIGANAPLLWCGDLNVARHPIDVSNPQTKLKHVCYHQTVRDTFEDILSFGFTDLFRHHNPDLVDYSFYDYRAPFNPDQKRGWRIDYVLATLSLAETSTDAGIDIQPRSRPKPSDHCPLYAVLKV
ncbi:MAG: exodeoxyribonuclease III [Kiritimatiellia bacterium]|jgi:exodeoxyribonuclease-3|nr:exodeoxyribonuclease III [Kiritimatiellia bacterium]